MQVEPDYLEGTIKDVDDLFEELVLEKERFYAMIQKQWDGDTPPSEASLERLLDDLGRLDLEEDEPSA